MLFDVFLGHWYKKSEILGKITFLGIFGQILPKTPIVRGGRFIVPLSVQIFPISFLQSNKEAYRKL